MDRYLAPILFRADFSSGDLLTRPSFTLRTAKEVGFKEDWLERAIAADPELVIAACREAELTDEAWVCWGRQFSVEPVGAIDVMLVSESGRVAIVETKLSYNPDARRSVIAQVLEYATHLPAIDFARLPHVPQTSGRPVVDPDVVQSRVQEGDYLLVVAGDRLDARAVKLGQALLGRHLVRGWDLALVEVAVFKEEVAQPDHQFLLVPHLRGAVIAEQRQVVRVVIEGERTRVDVQPTAPVGGSRTRKQQSSAELIEKIVAAVGAGNQDRLKEFLTRSEQLGVQPKGRGTSLTLLWSPPSASHPFTFGSIYEDGKVSFDYVMHYFRQNSLDEQLGGHYISAISALVPGSSVVDNLATATAWKWFDIARGGRGLTLRDLLPHSEAWLALIHETMRQTSQRLSSR
jgi:hypothetical protein